MAILPIYTYDARVLREKTRRVEKPDPSVIKVGATIDVFLEKMENQDGLVVLSKERADFLDAIRILPGSPREHNDPNNPSPFWRKGAVVSSRIVKLALDRGFDWTTHLGDFQHTVLFLRGELNENMPLAHQQELASHFASSEMITVLGAGHEAIWEKQDEFLSHIRAYLAEIGVAPVVPLGGAR